MPAADLRQLVEQYMAALESQNLSRCLEFYDDGASIRFQGGLHAGTFTGRADLEEWHRGRFAANLKVVSIENIDVDGDTVTVDGVATSDRLKAWKIGQLTGTATFTFEDRKIKDVYFGLRMYNPLEGW